MMNMLSRRAALVALAAALAFAGPAAALPREDNALVDKAIACLDGINDVKASFTQTDQRGDVAQGELYLARPGRARFEYAPPSSLLITSDGRTVIVSNSRLKTFQRLPLRSTPLAVFLAQHIRLDRGARVMRVDRSPGGFSVTARDSRGLAQGQITLYFSDEPVRLLGWAIRDAEGRVTRVTLGPMTPIPAPSPSLFTQSRTERTPAGGM